jgi:hypothetical protein
LILKRYFAALLAATVLSACSQPAEQSESAQPSPPALTTASEEITAADFQTASDSAMPNLQAEILDDRNKQSATPLGAFDFKNHTYPLPRGWQNPDSDEITLINGRVEPVAVDTDIGMDPDEIAERKARRRIGMSYVTTKFFDVTGDGQDEAFVILKVETTGAAIPQIVYVYTWKENQPDLIWPFRTGDRADGGLKDLRVEGGDLVVELYGQDRFLLGEIETSKITNDEEQLCCPTYYTRSRYNWNGNVFRMQGKRLTFSVAEPHQPPVENMMEIVERQEKIRIAKR